MTLGAIPFNQVSQSALIAYFHYLSFMLCFAALAVERIKLRSNPDRKEAIAMIATDIVYGLAGLTLLVTGILRVLYFGQGSEFYTQNPLFWIKVSIFIVVGLLSLYPTITYVMWAFPISKGELPKVNSQLVDRLKLITSIELIGFAFIPLFATLMARGIGYP